MPDSVIESDIGVGKTSAFRDYCIVVFDGFLIEPPLGTFSFEIEGQYKDLADVCTDLWSKVDVPSSRVDVTQLESIIVEGDILPDRGDAASKLEELADIFKFDWSHRDCKEVAVLRGGNVVVSVPDSDLCVRNLAISTDRSDAPNTTWKDADVLILPQRRELQFHDASRYYHTNVRASWRDAPPFGNQQDKQATSTNIVLTGPQAQRVVDIDLYQAWEEAQEFVITLGTTYRHLTAGDPIEISLGGYVHRVRLTGAQKEQFGVLAFNAVKESAEIYNAGLGEDTGGLPPVSVDQIGEVTYALIQTTAITDGHNVSAYGSLPSPIIYVGATAPSSSSFGRVQFTGDPLSGNNGEGDNSFTYTNRATMGYAVNDLPDYSGGSATWDEDSHLDVDLIYGSFESATEAAILADPKLNKIISGVEQIQFRTATFLGVFDGAKRYRLEGMLRGCRGTEWAMAEHSTGEPVLLMNAATFPIQLEPRFIGREASLSVNTHGEAGPISILVTGANLKPYAPFHIILDSVEDDDITFSWTNRTRYKDAADNWWQTGNDPPMGEESEKYEVEILNDEGGVVFTARDLTSREFTYTSEQQIIDFGEEQETLNVAVYQISATVGRGFAGKATITV
jgi:hypothetical protein